MQSAKLRIGTEMNTESAAFSFEVYLRGFDIEYVEYADYRPLQRLANGT